MGNKVTAEELLAKAKKPAKLSLAYIHSTRERYRLCQNARNIRCPTQAGGKNAKNKRGKSK